MAIAEILRFRRHYAIAIEPRIRPHDTPLRLRHYDIDYGITPHMMMPLVFQYMPRCHTRQKIHDIYA